MFSHLKSSLFSSVDQSSSPASAFLKNSARFLRQKDSEWKCLLDIMPKNKNHYQVHQPGKNTILSITYWKYKARSVAMIACSTSLITLL